MSAAQIGDQEHADSPARKRRVAFSIIAVLIPVAFFALIETGLRVANVAAYPPLFVPAPVNGYLQPNEAAMQRFFSRPGQVPGVSIDTTYFASDKSDDALRIFVQGGSTAAGFPYGKWASPAGMLKRRLRRSYPERNIEVISTAMAAINSYALLDFADEIIAQRPDAVLIYAGHNEYLGVMGVGSAVSSSRSPALTRTIMRLRRLRLYRLLETTLAAARSTDDAPKSGTLMARIAGERNIPFGSPLFARGVDQYRGNMDALLSKYRRAGIPVLIATLASNDRQQAPFTSALAPTTDEARFNAELAAGRAALTAGETAAALSALARAVTLDGGAADAWYALGNAHLKNDTATAARHAFLAARDRDQLRFRAPTKFNEILRQLSARHGATLVDAQAALAAESPAGVIGGELILEHLHPNVRGYFLLADAFFDALVDTGLAGPRERAIDDDLAWHEQPVTEIDALAAQYRLAVLLADWPFQQDKQSVSLPPAIRPVEQIAQAWYVNRISWPEAMNRALVYYQQQNDIDNAVRVALNLAEAFHFLANVQYIAGQLLVQKGETRLALHYLERAVELDPRGDYLIALATGYEKAAQPAAARRVLQDLLRREPRHVEAQQLLESLR